MSRCENHECMQLAQLLVFFFLKKKVVCKVTKWPFWLKRVRAQCFLVTVLACRRVPVVGAAALLVLAHRTGRERRAASKKG